MARGARGAFPLEGPGIADRGLGAEAGRWTDGRSPIVPSCCRAQTVNKATLSTATCAGNARLRGCIPSNHQRRIAPDASRFTRYTPPMRSRLNVVWKGLVVVMASVVASYVTVARNGGGFGIT